VLGELDEDADSADPADPADEPPGRAADEP